MMGEDDQLRTSQSADPDDQPTAVCSEPLWPKPLPLQGSFTARDSFDHGSDGDLQQLSGSPSYMLSEALSDMRREQLQKQAPRKLATRQSDDTQADEAQLPDVALLCLRRDNLVRKAAIAIVQSKAFDYFILAMILCNCIALAISSNRPGFDDTELGKALQVLNYVFLAVFGTEMLIKWVAMGLLLSKGTYFRNGWNILDALVVLMGLLEATSVGKYTALRAVRVLRPLRTITRIDGLKAPVVALFRSLPMLGDVAILCGFSFFVFGIIGVQLFAGDLQRRCSVPDFTYASLDHNTQLYTNVSYTPALDDTCCSGYLATDIQWRSKGKDSSTGRIGGTGTAPATAVVTSGLGPGDGYVCPLEPSSGNPLGLVCAPHGNINYGMTSFDNILWSWLTIFQCVTQEGWTDIMYATQDAVSIWVWMYFLAIILFGSFFIVNLAVAVLYLQFCKGETLPVMAAPAPGWVAKAVSFMASNNKAAGDSNGGAGEASAHLEFAKSCVARRSTAGGLAGSNGALQDATASQLSSAATAEEAAVVAHVIVAAARLPGSMEMLKPSKSFAQEQSHMDADSTFVQQQQHTAPGGWLSQLHRVWQSMAGLGASTRRHLKVVVKSKAFKRLNLFIIVANTAVMASKSYPIDPAWERADTYLNYGFSGYFLLEMVLKWAALGVVPYFRSRINQFDAVVVAASVAELILDALPGSLSAGGLSVLRSFRLMRILKLARSWTELQRVLRSITESLGSVFWLSVLLLLFVFILALMGMQLFGWKMTRCDVPGAHQLCPPGLDPDTDCPHHLDCYIRCPSSLVGQWFPVVGSPYNGLAYCEAFPRTAGASNSSEYWAQVGKANTPRSNFDTIGWSLYTVFQIITTENWNAVMYNIMQSTAPEAALFCVVVVIVGNYMLLNLFLAVLLEKFGSSSPASSPGDEGPEERSSVAGRLQQFIQGSWLGRIWDRRSNQVADSMGEITNTAAAAAAAGGSKNAAGWPELAGVGGTSSRQLLRPAATLDATSSSSSRGDALQRAALQTPAALLPAACPAEGARAPSAVAKVLCPSPSPADQAWLQPARPASTPAVLGAPSAAHSNTPRQRPSQEIGSRSSAGGQWMALSTALLPELSRFPAVPQYEGSLPVPPRRSAELEGLQQRVQGVQRQDPQLPATDNIAEVVGAQQQPTEGHQAAAQQPQGGSSRFQEDAAPAGASFAPTASQQHDDIVSSASSTVLGTRFDDGPPAVLAGDGREAAKRTPKRSGLRIGGLPGDGKGALVTQKSNFTTLGTLSPKSRDSKEFSPSQSLFGASLSRMSIDWAAPKAPQVASAAATTAALAAGPAAAVASGKGAELAPAAGTPLVTAWDNMQGSKIIAGVATSRTPLWGSFHEAELEGTSCFLLGPQNKLRMFLHRAIHHPGFDFVVLLCILTSSICLALDTPNLSPTSQMKSALNTMDIVFTAIFAVEAFMKILATGFLFTGPHAYIRNPWNFLDFAVMVTGLAHTSSSTDDSNRLSALRALRTLRALRPLRMVSRLQGMKVVVNALFASIPPLANVALVCMLFYVVFGIMTVDLFAGGLANCQDASGSRLDPDYILPAGVKLTKDWCESGPQIINASAYHSRLNVSMPPYNLTRGWVHPRANFDNIFNAMVLLFSISTTELWVDTTMAAVDIVGPEQQPIVNNNPIAALFFVVFVCFGAFFVLQLFVSVSLEKFGEIAKGGAAMLTPKQEQWLTIQRMVASTELEAQPDAPKHPARQLVFKMVNSQVFEGLVLGIILANMAVLAMAHAGMDSAWSDAMSYLNTGFAAAFAVEALLKVTALGVRQYWKDPWCRFDLVVVVVSIVACGIDLTTTQDLSYLPLLRVLRVVRIFRLIPKARGLQTLLQTLIFSLPALGNVGSVLFLLFFIYSIVGMDLFGLVKQGQYLSRHANFRDVGAALLTLFRMITGEQWNGIMQDCMVSSACKLVMESVDLSSSGGPRVAAGTYLDPGGPLLDQLPGWVIQDQCGPTYAVTVLFFFSFIPLCGLTLVNFVIGVIIDNMQASARTQELPVSSSHLLEFQEAWSQLDTKATNFIPAIHLSSLLEELSAPMGVKGVDGAASKVLSIIMSVDIPIHKGNKIHFLETLHALAGRVAGTELPEDEELPVHERMAERLPNEKASKYTVAHFYAALHVQASIKGFLQRHAMVNGPAHLQQ